MSACLILDISSLQLEEAKTFASLDLATTIHFHQSITCTVDNHHNMVQDNTLRPSCRTTNLMAISIPVSNQFLPQLTLPRG